MDEDQGLEKEQDPESEELFERVNFMVDRHQEPLRIDKFLVNRIEHATRNKIQQGAESGMILVNDKPVRSNYRVKPLDHIVVMTSREPELTEIIPEDLPLNVIYEDEDLLVLNKPPGMVVHPGSGNPRGTLVNGLAHYIGPGLEGSPIPRFGLVHRIDKNTTGLLVVAKSPKALSGLAGQFFEHSVNREYIALVWGDMELEQGTIAIHVGRHQRFRKIMDAYPDGDHGKPAVTHYQVLERFGYTTLIACRLETGRTHQIRVHMQHMAHPIFNDGSYGGDRIVKGTIFSKYRQFVENCFAIMPRLALHARSLGFIHPRTLLPLYFACDLPVDFAALVDKWRVYTRSSVNR